MYPDNYMNPMNNPMTNPNYGYNRMQQVQQMQRAINPQVPIKEQKDLGLTNDILMETFKSAIKPLKYSDKEVYDEVVDKLYKECYGEHFSDWLAEKAVENFKNVDGTEGAHWSVEQIDDVIRQYGIKCIGFNRWDLYFVMNMLYSDYYNVLGSDTATYVKMSKAWFEDPDVSEGKAYRYYMQVAKA